MPTSTEESESEIVTPDEREAIRAYAEKFGERSDDAPFRNDEDDAWVFWHFAEDNGDDEFSELGDDGAWLVRRPVLRRASSTGSSAGKGSIPWPGASASIARPNTSTRSRGAGAGRWGHDPAQRRQ